MTLASMLLTACDDGHLETVVALIEAGADKNLETNGDTPLCVASARGHVRIVKKLLENGNRGNSYHSLGVVIGLRGVAQATRVGAARETCKRRAGLLRLDRVSMLNVLGFLVLQGVGAEIEQVNSKSQTPLHCASLSGHDDVISMLLQAGACKERETLDGSTALILSAERGNAEAVKVLLAAGVAVNKAASDGFTALLAAAHTCRNPDLLQVLIDGGADVNAAGEFGTTALWLASCTGHAATVQTLLQAGADADMASDGIVGEGGGLHTPRSIAMLKGHTRVVKLFE
jgi:ankyrin repeat protein